MNQLIKQITELTVRSVVKTYSLLDTILGEAVTTFPDDDIRLNQNDMSFAFTIGDTGYKCSVITDLNTKSINIRAIDNNDTIVAECAVDVFGKFRESYSRIDSKDVKTSLVKWFTTISNIDVEHLSDEIEHSSDIPTVEAEEVIPDVSDPEVDPYIVTSEE